MHSYSTQGQWQDIDTFRNLLFKGVMHCIYMTGVIFVFNLFTNIVFYFFLFLYSCYYATHSIIQVCQWQ